MTLTPHLGSSSVRALPAFLSCRGSDISQATSRSGAEALLFGPIALVPLGPGKSA